MDCSPPRRIAVTIGATDGLIRPIVDESRGDDVALGDASNELFDGAFSLSRDVLRADMDRYSDKGCDLGRNMDAGLCEDDAREVPDA